MQIRRYLQIYSNFLRRCLRFLFQTEGCGAVRNTTAAVSESVRVWDHINDFIRDQVIYSCRLKRLRKKLLAERDLKLKRVLHLAERQAAQVAQDAERVNMVSGSGLTRFNKICHPSQRPRWQVDKEAIGLSIVQQCSSTYNPPS